MYAFTRSFNPVFQFDALLIKNSLCFSLVPFHQSFIQAKSTSYYSLLTLKKSLTYLAHSIPWKFEISIQRADNIVLADFFVSGNLASIDFTGLLRKLRWIYDYRLIGKLTSINFSKLCLLLINCPSVPSSPFMA